MKTHVRECVMIKRWKSLQDKHHVSLSCFPLFSGDTIARHWQPPGSLQDKQDMSLCGLEVGLFEMGCCLYRLRQTL